MLVTAGLLFPAQPPNCWGRFARHLGGRNGCRSWAVVPRTPFQLAVFAPRNVKKVHDGSEVASRPPDDRESELKNFSRSIREASKGQVGFRTSNAPVDKGWQRVEDSAVGLKPKTRVTLSVDEQNRSRDGREPGVWRVENTSKQSSGRNVFVGSEIPKPGNTSSRYLEQHTSTSFSTKAGPSSVGGSETTELGLGAVRSDAISTASPSPRPAETKDSMNSQQRPGPYKQGPVEGKSKQQIERKAKKKTFPIEAILRRDLNMCSKDGDVLRSLEIYDQSVKEGTVKWTQYNFNILLYLCSSAALGTLTARKSGTDRAEAERLNLQSAQPNTVGEIPMDSKDGSTVQNEDLNSNGAPVGEDGGTTATPIVLSPEVMDLAAKRGFEIFEDMKREQVPPNEATLTAVARLAVWKGDGDLAFQMVKEMGALNIAPKLRSFSPALVTFCKAKNVKKAFEVDAHMLSVGVQPEEPELGSLLLLCVDLRLEKEVYSLLHRLRVRVRELSPTTVSAIEQWFSGEAGSAAGKGIKQPDETCIRQAVLAGGGGWHGLGWLGKGDWKLVWSNIDSQGVCCSCKEQLVTIDLDPHETENFAQSVSRLAFARETKPNEFKRFQEWLERHGPFDAIIDGANVGLYNQNFAQGGFNFFQLNSVVRTAQEQGLVKKAPLILLHHARTRFGAANTTLAQQLLKRWTSTNTLYTTPNGSNDDWYWLYAAVRYRCLLITNDEMRDHLFQLLGTDFFPKWKERHQVRFSATTRGPQFHLPPPYSLVIQESEKGSWHIPQIGGNDIETPRQWLCITRPAMFPDSASEKTPAENMKVAPQTTYEMDVMVAKNIIGKDPIVPSGKIYSPDSDRTGESSGVKRSRAHSPSTTLRKIRAADKRSDSGPVIFDI